MPVSHKHQCIFVHIPKTAGTSIEWALNMHGEKDTIGIEPAPHPQPDQEHLFGPDLTHLTLFEIKKRLTFQQFRSYFKFAVVRNPYDRVVSHYAWLDRKWHERSSEITQAEFKNWLVNWKVHHRHLKPQYEYFYDWRGKSRVDLVGRYERLEATWGRVQEQLDLPASGLEVRMKSNHLNWQTYYDEESAAIVANRFKKDFVKLGYDLNSYLE